MDGKTGNSLLEEDPLSLSIKKDNIHETEQTEYLFVPLAKTDNELTIFKQSMEAQIGNSFLDEDLLSSSIKKEIKHETEQGELPLAMIDDKRITYRQDVGEEAINDVEEQSTESSLRTSKCVVCSKLKYNCICDNVNSKEYDFNSFSYKEKCLQITEKNSNRKEPHMFSSSYSHMFFVRSLSHRDLL